MNYIYEVLVPFRRSHLFVGNAACPVPAKPSFRRARRLHRRSRELKTPCTFLYSHIVCFQSAVHNDHTQRRIEGGATSSSHQCQNPLNLALRLLVGRRDNCPLHHKINRLFHIENCCCLLIRAQTDLGWGRLVQASSTSPA